MQFPKLSPLQSRFAASFLACTIVLVLLYLTLARPHIAYAAELDSTTLADHNHPVIFDADFDDDNDVIPENEDHFNDIELRQTASNALALANNQPQNKQISPGETQSWVFTKQSIEGPAGEVGKGLPTDSKRNTEGDGVVKAELRKRQDAQSVYVSLNTCEQPSSSTNGSDNSVIPPQLLMSYSTSAAGSQPTSITVDGGYGLVNITADTDVYIFMSAPNTTAFTGQWSYVIAASIDAPYHSVVDDTPNLHFVDADTHAALLITSDLTQDLPNSTVYQEWMNLPAPPYGMFAQDQRDASILGVARSYCGLRTSAKSITLLENVNNQNIATMTTRGLGGKPKEQFYVTSLNASSTYWGFLAMQGNSSDSGLNVVGGGGQVWAAMNFTTKIESNCALMYNLSFCSEVAYAVPANPDLFSPRDGLPQLAALYDSYAATMYQNFNYSLQQIPCNTTASAQYSLARNCDDCARAYKQWLCAVTIPRCEDFTNTAPYLKPRNLAQPFPNGTTISELLSTSPGLLFPSLPQGQQQNPDIGGGTPNPNNLTTLLNAVATNSSRNSLIDTQIQPGPYKEVLPCDDLCYDLVQSCPAALGFGCPLPGQGLEQSYGFRSADGGEITCSYLGAAYYLSSATRIAHLIGLKNRVLIGWVVVLSWMLLS